MRLQRITLLSNDLNKIKKFYSKTLGFKLMEESSEMLQFQCGKTILEFYKTTGQPYYHFAFNIPSFQIQEALIWLKKRVLILKEGELEIIDFKHWNADAIYFKDPVGNILEFIARKNLGIPNSKVFSINSISEISEIGIPVSNVKATFQHLHQIAGLVHYWGDQQNFCATGDEQGLFILVNKASKVWYPTDIKAKSFPLEVLFSSTNQHYRLNLNPLQIHLQLSSVS